MFEYSKELIEKKMLGTDFARKRLVIGEHHENSTTDVIRRLWEKCADFGLFMLPIPRSLNGLEEDLVSIVLLMEGIGYGSNEVGIMFSANAHIWACEIPILHFGTESQKSRYLPKLGNGEKVGAHAISEQEAGSDVWNLQTTYSKTKGGYCLNGIKAFVTNAPFAHIFLIFARKIGSNHMKGISCFIVEQDTPGLTIGNSIDKMGLEYSPFSSVYLDNCIVPEENLLGGLDQGHSIFNFTMEYERPFILSFQVGLMENLLEKCVEYSRARKQFDRKIISFQSISNKLANMKVRLEVARLLTHQIAFERMNSKSTFLNSSIAKLFISESMVQNSMDAIDIFGAYGYVKQYGIEKYLRDSIASKIYSGTSDVQRNIISRLM